MLSQQLKDGGLWMDPHTRTGRREREKKKRRILLKATTYIVTITLLVSFVIYGYAKIFGPPSVELPQPTNFYGANGEVIGELKANEKRMYVPLQEISPTLIDAFVSVEDKRFYTHHGFDYRRIGGAILIDLKAGAKVQGASTITQQYARNLYLSHEKTWKRKFLEALYTIRLETNYDKDQILEGYVNTVYFGHGIYGVEAASRYFFHKPAKDLTLAEASMLAGVPKGPTIYSPKNNFEKAKERQSVVLKTMVNNGKITEEQRQQAMGEYVAIYGDRIDDREPVGLYFQDIVRAQLKALELDEETLKKGGLHIYTTLHPDLQRLAEKQVKAYMPTSDPDLQVAFSAIDPKTGDVLALVGGRDYETSTFNRATQAKRMPGSTMKPILYYEALEQGYTPATMIQSEETTFTLEDGSTYTPRNYRNYYPNKEITIAQALAVSDNIVAVKTNIDIGPDKLAKRAKKIGIKSDLSAVPSLALGTSTVRLNEMVTAYSHFANGGHHVKPVYITKIVDAKGKVLYEHTYNLDPVLDEKKAAVTTHLMTGMFDTELNGYTTVTGAKIASLFRGYEVAGKTGSTNSDSWMIGFTPKIAAGVWIGYDDNRDLTGYSAVSRDIWAHFIKESLPKEKLTFEKPDGVISVKIDPETGKVATKNCPTKRTMYFEKGTEPTETCPEHEEKQSKPKKDKKEKEDKENKSWWKKIWE